MQSVKSSSPTGNLAKHLKEVHGIILKIPVTNSLKESRQKSMMDFIKQQVKPMNAAEKAAQDLKLTKLVCDQMLPFKIVNEE